MGAVRGAKIPVICSVSLMFMSVRHGVPRHIAAYARLFETRLGLHRARVLYRHVFYLSSGKGTRNSPKKTMFGLPSHNNGRLGQTGVKTDGVSDRLLRKKA